MAHTVCIRYLFAIASFVAADDPAIPIVREVIYKNAHHVPRKELDELSGIRPGDPLDLDANQAACERIQDYLKKRGRYWATVSLEKGNVGSDTQVIFIVSEGPIVRVRLTQFVGNQALTSQQLLKEIHVALPFVGSIGIFGALLTVDDTIKIREVYRVKGYPDAKISRVLTFSDDLSQVDVTYCVDERTQRAEKSNPKGNAVNDFIPHLAPVGAAESSPGR